MLVESKNQKIASPDDLAEIMRKILDMRPEEEQHKEYLYTIGLNNQNVILYIDLVGMGTVNGCNIYVREILRQAIIKNASNVVLVHNHPSGDTRPSAEDLHFTKKISQACKLLEIKLIDHIILGTGFHSMADAGDL